MIPPRFREFIEQIIEDGDWEHGDGTSMTEDAKAMLAPDLLHTIGTVYRVRGDSRGSPHDYGDIKWEGGSLTGALLCFEGKRVEVLVRLIETQEVPRDELHNCQEV